MKEVAIFGAGIAGLTAAHELIERGFRVEVYERDEPSAVDLLNDRFAPCAIGGMARTQWSRVERPDDTSDQPRTLQPGEKAKSRHWTRLTQIKFTDASMEFAPGGLEQVVTTIRDDPTIRRLQIQGYTSSPFDVENENLALRRAQKVRAVLADMLRDRAATPWERSSPDAKDPDDESAPLEVRMSKDRTIELFARAEGIGRIDEWWAVPGDRNVVGFHVIEDLLPGEHGFRFFPAFYRNLFDTMRRTPISEASTVFRSGTRTTFDNLIGTKFQGYRSTRNRSAFVQPRSPTRSIEDLLDQLGGAMTALGVTPLDLARYQQAVFKYVTSCPERRAKEYEDISWWDFLDADRFSEGFRISLESTSQALVAMLVRECDARTFGTVSVQLLLDQLRPEERVDATLNGPTSLAWFDHWRRYLESQGVEFKHGELVGFVPGQHGEPWPVVKTDPRKTGTASPTVVLRDYYVMALPARDAQQLARDNIALLRGDDFDRLRRMDLGNPRVARPGGASAHMSGVQYFFDRDMGFREGHTIYPESEWRLSSISQVQFWNVKRGWWSGYRGVLSVDISSFFNPSQATRRAAWDSTKHEIAEEVWRQIRSSLSDEEQRQIADPRFYHFDENITFASRERREATGVIVSLELPADNTSPYVLNIKGRFAERPGKPGAYELQCGTIVLAGTYTQTHTRLMTMESANESARHAVNAILENEAFGGLRCTVWNPEDHEPREVVTLIDIDRRLVELGLPHITDILGPKVAPSELLRSDLRAAAVGR